MFFVLAAFKSIFPKPTAKLDIIFTESESLLMVSSLILSTIEHKIPSQSLLNSIYLFCE